MTAPYTLHGIWLSGPTYKVGLMLALTQQKFDYDFINLREGAHKAPAYTAINRFGVVPTLTVAATGKNLTQAAAILGYLAQTTGKFAGSTPDEQQEIREWMLWSYDRLVPPVYRSRGFKLGLRQMDAATVAMYSADGNAALKFLDGHLAGKLWLVGNAASIADIDNYGVAYYAAEGGFDMAQYPNVKAWMGRIEALPGYGKPEAILPKVSQPAA